MRASSLWSAIYAKKAPIFTKRSVVARWTSRWAAALVALLVVMMPKVAQSADSGAIGCAPLLGVNQEGPSITGQAQQFMVLMQLGLKNLGTESPAFQSALKAATESPDPINPFLNLKSYPALALSQRAESVIEGLQASDWVWVQGQIRSFLAGERRKASSKERDITHTAEVGGFEFISDEALAQALQGTNGFGFSNTGSTKAYVGRVDEQFFFTVTIEYKDRPEQYYGLVGISFPKGVLGPNINWLVRSESADITRTVAERELSRVEKSNFFVLRNKLYAIGKKKEGDYLVQIDASTGAVLKRETVPGRHGRTQIYNLGHGRIVGAGFDSPIPLFSRPIVRQFYLFDQISEKFVPTGLDLGFLKAQGLSVEKYENTVRILFQDVGAYQTDGENLFVKEEGWTLDRIGLESTRGWSFLTDWWGKDGGERLLAKIRSRSPHPHLRHKFILHLEIIKESSQTSAVDARANRRPEPTKDRILKIPIPYDLGDPKIRRINVVELPGTEMFVVYLTGSRPPEFAWLVHRKTLEYSPLTMPTNYYLAANARTGEWADGLRSVRAQNSNGQHVKVYLDADNLRAFSMTLNAQTLQFEGPDVFPVPTVGEISDLVFSEDFKSVEAQITQDGLWLTRKYRVTREGEL